MRERARRARIHISGGLTARHKAVTLWPNVATGVDTLDWLSMRVCGRFGGVATWPVARRLRRSTYTLHTHLYSNSNTKITTWPHGHNPQTRMPAAFPGDSPLATFGHNVSTLCHLPFPRLRQQIVWHYLFAACAAPHSTTRHDKRSNNRPHRQAGSHRA
jgi:hypothetical protein